MPDQQKAPDYWMCPRCKEIAPHGPGETPVCGSCWERERGDIRMEPVAVLPLERAERLDRLALALEDDELAKIATRIAWLRPGVVLDAVGPYRNMLRTIMVEGRLNKEG